MMRAYTFLSLLIITSAARSPIFAQPTTPSPTITRQSFMAEALRRRSPSAPIGTSTPRSEEPILRIETVALRLPNANAGLGQPKPWLKSLSDVYTTALFQRQRSRETGQPIEFERGALYFRRDRFVVTKGLILYRLWNDRIDFGIYKRSFQNEASPLRGQAMWFGQTDPSGRGYLLRGGRQIFFGVRFNLDKPPQQKH